MFYVTENLADFHYSKELSEIYIIKKSTKSRTLFKSKKAKIKLVLVSDLKRLYT